MGKRERESDRKGKRERERAPADLRIPNWLTSVHPFLQHESDRDAIYQKTSPTPCLSLSNSLFFLLPFLSSAHEHYTRYATNNVKFYTLFYFSIFESKISCDTITIFTVNCLGMLVCIDKYLIFRTVRCTMKVN